MKYSLPPLVRDAKRLMFDIEQTVSRFPVKRKYCLGKDLREKSLQLAVRAMTAAQDKKRRSECLTAIDQLVKEIKVQLELGQKLNVYSTGRHDELFLIVADIGKQCGKWLEQHLMSQSSAPRSPVAPERAPILSAGAASSGANV